MEDYKSMQAMRQISKAQRKNTQTLWDLLASLCLTLEKRMVKQNVYCREIIFNLRYEDGKYYREIIHCENPVQEGSQLLGLIKNRMKLYQQDNNSEPVINTLVNMMGVNVFNFVPGDIVQFDLFDNNVQRHKLRKAVSDIREKFGKEIIKKAVEKHEKEAMVDAIGFGSVKHLY
jgi:DNA polymerase-4